MKALDLLALRLYDDSIMNPRPQQPLIASHCGVLPGCANCSLTTSCCLLACARLDYLLILGPIFFGFGSALFKAVQGTVDFSTQENIITTILLVFLPVSWGIRGYMAMKKKVRAAAGCMALRLLPWLPFESLPPIGGVGQTHRTQLPRGSMQPDAMDSICISQCCFIGYNLCTCILSNDASGHW